MLNNYRIKEPIYSHWLLFFACYANTRFSTTTFFRGLRQCKVGVGIYTTFFDITSSSLPANQNLIK